MQSAAWGLWGGAGGSSFLLPPPPAPITSGLAKWPKTSWVRHDREWRLAVQLVSISCTAKPDKTRGKGANREGAGEISYSPPSTVPTASDYVRPGCP